MNRKIYLLEGETLQPLREAPYDSEALLQRLLANYPDILAGEQISETAPRRWLLISREYGIPDEGAGSDRWALDHLFLDQDGIPTLVEVKRSADTRTRRNVVGQMLDYAANAVRYWPVEDIRARHEAAGEDAHQRITDLLDIGPDDEEAVAGFWQDVKTNLRAGRIRMVFVADDIPTELRRIVEFLNEQMDPTEVLAVEVKQYVGDGLRTLVPKVVGQTAEAQQRKSTARSVYTEDAFFDDLRDNTNDEVAAFARRLHDWIIEQPGGVIDWRTNGFMAYLETDDARHGLFKVTYKTGSLQLYANHYNGSDSGDDAFTRQWSTFRERMKQIGLDFPEETTVSKKPKVALADLIADGRSAQVRPTFSWVIEQLCTHAA